MEPKNELEKQAISFGEPETKKITYEVKENGLLWPYYQGKKAWSPSSLIEILKLIEYGDKQIPEYVLRKAADNGKLFHQIIQKFVQTGNSPTQKVISLSVQKKLKETICFLEQNKKNLGSKRFLRSEKLHHTFYKEVLIATYVDLEFDDCIVELKTNNIKMHESPLTLLAFQIQLLIQHLCTKKEVYLLWSTGDGVIFHRFQASPSLFKILDLLIDLVKKKDTYTLKEKRAIVEKILLDYVPHRLIDLN
ncbi:hypothetical protein [endosymbiont GvMRE of Glomus versiforme]|uniref:hypothetical protein n=1 Tax=endosymbiont GvMRE of Glomus versiforme TaxID=2039283 RepID=UPI000ED66C9E|nr:hypothetical protein [endosymbiont GvMRE of Glomus versiforme]RHZ37190.1 hypothetical protein GvMRE_I1g48 [endosymbiont GvMRE of Glomus versiforme]